jgi:tetratricopeptide (TPR) repeat protein
LHAVNSAPAPEQTTEQSDYLAIFVADRSLGRDEDKVIALCQAFIARYPATAALSPAASPTSASEGTKVAALEESSHLPEVRMKLGQVYFRREEFNLAQMQFELLAGEAPSSLLAEKALFMAGEASVKSRSQGGLDHAIEVFGKVAKLNGLLKPYARLQQADIQNKQGKPEDAVNLYKDILAANPPTEVKFAALAGQGRNLFELGTKDAANYEEALKAYQELAEESNTSSGATWRASALYQKGKCLEALKRPDEALAAYYDVLQAGVTKPHEYFWFYRAGFDAGHLCEAQEQWKSAVGVYQKMAALEGPRAEEAKAQVTRLCLEHFIWE